MIAYGFYIGMIAYDFIQVCVKTRLSRREIAGLGEYHAGPGPLRIAPGDGGSSNRRCAGGPPA
jgi:hypothetical protein